MKYKLINPNPAPNCTPQEQILINRGIKSEELMDYINIENFTPYSPERLGEEKLWAAVVSIFSAIRDGRRAVLVVDSDCDGYTSAAILANYLHEIAPTWVENNLTFLMHEGKAHGLKEFIDQIEGAQVPLVICPDSASNDYDEHRRIKSYGGTCIVLDHHLADRISEDAIVINNQLSSYPNKDLSGAGVVYQFCRYIDERLGRVGSSQLLDLVALGLVGDMISLTSLETRHFVHQGMKQASIANPFIDAMLLKNEFPLSKPDYVSIDRTMACTPMGAAFFIVPFINAVTRSGTLEEKELLFNSMLNYKAYKQVPSTKRGHKTGEMESIVNQSLRMVTNVKNRQTKAEDAGLELLRRRVEEDNMLDHMVLLFLLEKDEIPASVRGLVANKLMAEYQRPVCVLTRSTYGEEEIPAYEGSCRGYTKNGVESFKDVVTSCIGTLYAEGHHNAFGMGLRADCIDEFIATTDAILSEYPHEPLYRVDYEWDESILDGRTIIEIASMNDYWGQDIDRALVLLKFKVTNRNFAVMAKQTLKFTLPHGITIVKFAGTEEEIADFTTDGFVEVEAVCKCSCNNWNGNSYPQLVMMNYEIVDSSKYFF